MTTVVNDIPSHEYNEIRNKNVFKKELLSVSKPFDLMQALYICSMYRIRDGFIIPNSVFYYVVSGIWSSLLIGSACFTLIEDLFFDEIEGLNFVKCSCNIILYGVYCFGNITNYWANVIHRYDNVSFAISIQNICEIMNVKGKTLKKFTLLNWVYVTALIAFRLFWTLYLNIAFSLVLRINETISSLVYAIFDVRMLYSVRLMRLLSETLRIWVDEVWKYKCMAGTENELCWNRTLTNFMEIMKTYKIFVKTFQTLTLYYCIDTFTYGVLAVWVRIEIAKKAGTNLGNITLSLIYLLWMVKSVVLVTVLSLECERFYTIMTEVRTVCIQLITPGSCSEAQRRFCKNIQRLQSASFKKMSACGLFIIDGALPFLMFGLLTTYIIVVLQFEFL